MGFDWWLHIMTFSGLNQFWSSTTFWQNIPIHKKNLSKFCNIILCPHRLLKSLSFLVVPSNNLGCFLNAGGTRLLPSGSLSMKSIPLHAIVRKNARFSTWRCRCRHIQLQDGREGVGKGGQAACYCPCCAACGRSGMHGTCVTLPPCPPPPIPVLHKLRKKASNMKANMQIQHLTYILTIFLACRQQDDQVTISAACENEKCEYCNKICFEEKVMHEWQVSMPHCHNHRIKSLLTVFGSVCMLQNSHQSKIFSLHLITSVE